MSFQTYLENLRSKPEHVQKRYAFWTSFGLTAIIFVFWISSFSVSNSTARGVVAKAVEKAGGPGSSMIAGVGNFFVDVKEMIFGTKKIVYKEVEVRAGDK